MTFLLSAIARHLPPTLSTTWHTSHYSPVIAGSSSLTALLAATPFITASTSPSGCPSDNVRQFFPNGFEFEQVTDLFHSWWVAFKASLPTPPSLPQEEPVGWRSYSSVPIFLNQDGSPRMDYMAEDIFSHLGVRAMPQLNDYEVGIAVSLVDTRILSTEWRSIGGLDSVIEELQESVIVPFQKAHLLTIQTRLLRPPKGVLLFGPPGCGKTMLARAMARAANAHFINLQVSTLVNMWYGETQKYVEATFSLAHKLQPSIIFIDELDSFLTSRSYSDNESTRMIKTQFMALWDGLLTEERTRILIVGATNRPNDLDQAILRRLPFKVFVPMPGLDQRAHILSLLLRGEELAKGLTDADILEVAKQTDGLSGSDLMEVCREAAFCCYRLERHRKHPEHLRFRPEHFVTALNKFLSNRVLVHQTGQASSDRHAPLD